MEKFLKLHIQKLPEGLYLATSETLQGLIAQGRTVAETLEIARDVARKLIEAKEEKQGKELPLEPIQNEFDYSIVVGS